MDSQDTIMYSWTSDYTPGLSVYLLETGELLRTGSSDNNVFDSGGAGGIVQLLDWDSDVIWQYEYNSDTYLQHHDVEILPDGHVLLVAWEMKTQTEVENAGRDLSTVGDGELWPDSIIEVDPTTDDIVWQWHVWDHLIQDYDSSKENYGTVADHPELINLNYSMNTNADWSHINSVDYSETYDQILLSVHNFSEIWIIDHSTTTEEAAGHSGGDYGKGGDLLYRWGNPQTYDDSASDDDQQLFVQHDADM